MNKLIDKQNRDEEIKASFTLDGIEFTEQDEKLFKHMDEKDMTSEESIEYIKQVLIKEK